MAYRSDVEALRNREEAIARELDELGDVVERKRRLERELEGVQEALRAKEVVPRRGLQILRAPAIPLPCDVPWEKMAGDARVRHCSSCDKAVYNLSGMTRLEAAELLERGGGLCVRYYQRPDGTVLTTDCPVGVRRRRRRRLPSVVAAAALAGSALAGLAVAERTEAVPYYTVDTFADAHRPHGLVRVDGSLVHGSIQHTAGGIRFELEGQGAFLFVRYPYSILPDTFRDVPTRDLNVLVEGTLDDDGMFVATQVLAKSPSGATYGSSKDSP